MEYFEEHDHFYLIFEKITGGQLLNHIKKRKCFTEKEATHVVSTNIISPRSNSVTLILDQA